MLTPRVLVATDFSEGSDCALRAAHDRAGAFGSLLVCHVWGWEPESTPVPRARGGTDLHETVARRVLEITGRSKDRFLVTVEHGEPYSAIVRRAEAWGADLVVVGWRGATGLSRVWLGSVAERVVRFAHCPVLVARPPRGTRRILAATDFSDPALPAIRAAFEEAGRTQGRVSLVHCLELPMMFPDPVGFVGPEASLTAADDARQDAEARLRAIGAETAVPVEYLVPLGRPAVVLTHLAEETEADLLVVGTRGRTGIARILLGSVAETVVRSAPCSVLAVRLGSGADQERVSGGDPPASPGPS